MEKLLRASFDSPIGRLEAVSSEKGLAYLQLPRANGRGFRGWKERHAGGSAVCDDTAANREVIEQVMAFLGGELKEFDLPLDIRATDFQREVYEHVAVIAYGETRSYGEVAQEVGRPKAVRAVGAANGANPVPLVVPCHRVIASGGGLQGYAGGLDMKKRLLAMEQNASSVQLGLLG